MEVKAGVCKMQNWKCKHEAQSVDELENMKLYLSILIVLLCIQDRSVNVCRFKYNPVY